MAVRYPLVILAGGKSSRMGAHKGLLDYDGRPWILEQFARFQGSGGLKIVVVLGFGAEEYFERVPELKLSLENWAPIAEGALVLRTIVNPVPELGPFSSLQAGIKYLTDEPGVFILPVDVPGASSEIWIQMSVILNAEEKKGLYTVIPRFESQGGHPVLISRKFMDHLLKVPSNAQDARLDVQLRKVFDERKIFLDVQDPAVCENFNTPEEWAKKQERSKG